MNQNWDDDDDVDGQMMYSRTVKEGSLFDSLDCGAEYNEQVLDLRRRVLHTFQAKQCAHTGSCGDPVLRDRSTTPCGKRGSCCVHVPQDASCRGDCRAQQEIINSTNELFTRQGDDLIQIGVEVVVSEECRILQVLQFEVSVAVVDEWMDLFCRYRGRQGRDLQNVWGITADVALNMSSTFFNSL